MTMIVDSLAMVAAAAADPVGSMLLGNGSLGIILFVVWKLGNKLVDKLISPVTDYIKRQDEATKLFKESHEHFHSEVTNIFQKLGEIDEHCHRLLEGSDGNITLVQARNLVSIYSSKVMSDTLLWWQERISQNGIHTNRDIIEKKYAERAELLKSKWISEMGMWRINGVSLDNWSDYEGVHNYFRAIFKKLFDVQVAMIDRTQADIIGTEVPVWLAHRVDQMIGAVDAYLKDGVGLSEYLRLNPLSGNTVEFL